MSNDIDSNNSLYTIVYIIFFSFQLLFYKIVAKYVLYFLIYFIKKESFSQDSPPAVGRKAAIFRSAAVRSPRSVFCFIGHTFL